MANNQRKKKRKMKKKKKILLFALEVLVLIVLLVVLYFFTILNKIDFRNMGDAGINKDMNSESAFAMEGYTNIALFGLDNRGSGNYDSGNSDAILIASINNETKDIKLISVYRDTYLSIGSGNYSKCNSAYEKGGAEQAVQMLNTNLDMDIENYVSVDWAALVKVIDGLGGIDINITEGEMENINLCTVEIDQMTGYDTPYLNESGDVHLDGTQATAYARIRALAGDDYMRAARQRIVMQAMMDKAKTTDLVTLTGIANDVFGDVSTSLSLKQLLLLAKDVTAYNLVETSGFPYDLHTADLNCGDSVVPVELDNNVAKLHEMLFGDANYKTSQTVQSISDNIVKKTGMTSDNTDVNDMDKYNTTTNLNGTDMIKNSTKKN